jgi:pilus assembly protein FimV
MKRRKLPPHRAVGTPKPTSNPQAKASALALAVAMALGVITTDAQALALGRVTVQSALGEPLRADIDIPEINADEVASLRASVASPDAFRAAGLEYSTSLSNVSITLQRRPDGRYFLRLTSDRPVNDPFVDLILETSWSSGRIVRDYTMLFDPPSMRAPAPAIAAQTSPGSQSVTPSTPAPRYTPAPAPAPRAAAPSAPTRSAPPRVARAPAEAPIPAPAGEGKRVTVQAGDTASKIAGANKPASVSLDQMLVAMLRSNPDAFIGGNINRLRAGAVLDLPSGEQASAVQPGEAHQTLVAQSRDFNEFRRRLAEGLPTTTQRGSDRVASGKVQARVEEKKPGANTPDRLTLSKGAVQGKAGTEDTIARQRAAQDAATRVAELNRNLSDLNRLSTGPGAPAAGSAASAPRAGVPVAVGSASAPKGAPAAAPASAQVAAAAKPASTPAAATSKPASAPAAAAASAAPAAAAKASSAPATSPAPAAAPVMPASPSSAPSTTTAAAPATGSAASSPSASSAPASSPAAATAASEPGASPASPASAPPAPKPAAAKPKAPPPPPPPEPSLVEDLLANPLIPGVVLAALALLLGVGVYRIRQRRKATQVDSSFLESRLQPDSFFGASGGQRIDTAESSGAGSSMVYSPSQLDAAGDVDPVAEADVYLAYGRDLQAEEILKEALRTNPQRVAIHAKLLEIYAKRRDAKAFEVVATEAYNITRGEGPEWEHICEMGRELDPSNPMYHPGGQPDEGALAAAAASTTSPGAFGATTAMPAVAPVEPLPATSDVDLDLDFSLGDDEPVAPAPMASPAPLAPPATEPTLAFDLSTPSDAPSMDMDFSGGEATGTFERPAEPEAVRLDAPDLTLDENSLNFSAEPLPAPAPAPTPAPAPPAADPGMIEFDLGALSLDLPPSTPPMPPQALEADTGDAPLSTGGLEYDSDSGEDPLATKLALAEEFNAIGDADGARSLAEEVLAEASGDLKSRAQKLLAEIG